MADSLKERAAAARGAALEAERDRIAANLRARELATIAANLEAQLERSSSDDGPSPQQAPVNLMESSKEELQAALAANVITEADYNAALRARGEG